MSYWKNIDDNIDNIIENTKSGKLLEKLILYTNDDLSEQSEYGININPLMEILYNYNYKLSPQLFNYLLKYLINYDLISYDEKNNIINVNESNNQKAALIMVKLQKLIN